MKLISLYIENFGGMHAFSLDFQKDLTVLCRPNGFGKTTLAEFIRAMFYGFPRKTKTLEKSKRQKYAPWNGGSFGGNLVFEQAGRHYRIERTFGAVPKADTFSVIDLEDNRRTDRFSEEIGIELFSVDSESFERCCYFPQAQEDGPLATASIQAKLTNLLEGDRDVTNFDKAMAQLRASRSALIPYRGSGGAVAETAESITRIQLLLDQALQAQEALAQLEPEIISGEIRREQIQEALAKKREALAKASEQAAIAARQSRYQELQRHYRQAAAQVAAVGEKYPAGLPQPQCLDEMEAMADQLAVLEAQEAAVPLLRESRIPAEEALRQCRRAYEKYEGLQTEIRALEQEVSRIQQSLYQNADVPKRSGIGLLLGGIAAMALGAAALFSGAGLLISRILPDGIMALGISAVMCTVGIWLLASRRRRMLQAREQNLRRSALEGKLAAQQQMLENLKQEAGACAAEISAFLEAHGAGGPPQHFLAGIAQVEHCAYLWEQHRQHREKRAADTEACREKLGALLKSCAMEPESDLRAQLRRMQEDLRDARAAENRARELAAQIKEMEQSCGEMLFADCTATEDPAQLRQQEQQLRQTLTELDEHLLNRHRQLRQLRQQAEPAARLREALEENLQNQAEYREKARILDETMDYLQRAREQLSTAYLGTVRSRFDRYLAQLEDSAGTYHVDGDLQVQAQRLGRTRELAYFSAGQVDLVMACMRLALVDALFRDQEMFVILDDPFVNLDDAHMAQARELLRSLSAHRQILYLTCHTSRTF